MRKLILILLLLSSCVGTKNRRGESDYIKMLTVEEKSIINEKGFIYKDIKIGDSNILWLGQVKIFKTNEKNQYHVVEVDKWVIKSNTPGNFKPIDIVDTIKYDTLGNIIQRKFYQESKNGVLVLDESWSSEFNDNKLIQHYKLYKNGKLIRKFSAYVVDFKTPKTDLYKEKIKFGIYKEFYEDGQLKLMKKYNDNGKVVDKESYGR